MLEKIAHTDPLPAPPSKRGKLTRPENSTSYAHRARIVNNPDAITLHLASIPSIPSRKVINEYALETRRKNDELHKVLLGSPYIARYALKLLKQAQALNGKADKLLEVSRKDSIQSTPQYKSLGSNIPTIEALLERCRALREELTSEVKKVAPQEEANIRHKIQSNQDKIYLLISETMIRRELLPLTLRKLEQLNQKTLNAQKQIAKLQRQKNPDLKMVEILQEKVRRNISDLGESLKAVSIRIALARKTEQEFHEAKGLLVQTALRLTVNLAKRYRNKGLTFEDLIGEGHIGLMRAAEKFDPARGNQFTTYATWWIRQSIRSAITNKSALIRMPAHLQQMRQQISEIRIELTHKNNREPSLDEISKEYLGRTKAATNKPPKKSKEITESVVLLSPGIRSLDDRAPEQRYSLGDIIREQSQTFEDIIEEDHKTWLREKVNQALDSLNPRKQLVIKLRFGIGTPDNNPMTLVQIGAVLGVTKERVRQLESNAKEDLKRLALN